MRRFCGIGSIYWLTCAGMLLAVLGIGCGQQGTVLDRDAFYRPNAMDLEPDVRQDPVRPYMYDNVRVDLMDPQGVRSPVLAPGAGGETAARPRVTAVSEAVRETVQVPGSSASPDAAGGNAATPPVSSAPRLGVTDGTAMTIGAVVCEVNGTPIYADKVLASLSKVFAVEAKRRNPRAFREFAENQIKQRVGLFIRAELTYAAAKRNLDTSEQDLANQLTMQWRTRQISEAGGSIAKARARAAAEGYDFEERVAEEHRANMVRVYYQKRLFPRAQVRADDMRRYYDRNLKTLFTERPQARFRVIKIEADKTGGREAARQKIENLRQRAARGEDFAEMARSVNDDPNLMRLAGDVGWVQRGAFAIEPVEEAVWKLQPSEVTDVIEVGDAYYIAQLDQRKAGRVRPFEEEAVQREIQKALENEMLIMLARREDEALLRDAIVYPDPPDMRIVLEMAMQKYPAWASAQ